MAAAAAFETRSRHRSFGGWQGFYQHASAACVGPMRFAVYLPPQAEAGPVPALYALAGLTCTEETFAAKAGAQRAAAAHGVALVTCDTSPRQARFPGDDAAWDLGQGAGFYLDATQAPWSAAYRMETYVTEELVAVVEAGFPIRRDRRGVLGHSMGGHGALTLAMRHPDRYASVSAIAPIAAPTRVPWGRKAFAAYLGDDRAAWATHDAVELLRAGRRLPGAPLVDQGGADGFLERELTPGLLAATCAEVGQPLTYRLHEGADHGYYFIASVVDDHIAHHARALVG